MTDKSTKRAGKKASQSVGIWLAPREIAAPPTLPADLVPFIGARPLLRGEDPAEYDAVFEKVAETVSPVDAIEWMWVKDVVDAVWERRRALIMRYQIVEMNRFRSLLSLVRRLRQEPPRNSFGRPNEDAEALVSAWLTGGTKGRAAMAEFLAAYDLDERVIATETFLSRGREFDQLDRMIAAADKRRDLVIREIERRRQSRASRFREAADIVDAETADDEAA